jgi:hypothetical protein
MGTYLLVLAAASVAIPVVMYFKLPIERDRTLVIVPLMPLALLTYPLTIMAAYWFQTGSKHDFFLRAGPGGIWVRFPEERNWFLPGYRVTEKIIPWEEIASMSSLLLVSNFIRIDSTVIIDKTDTETVFISACHFVENRKTILDNLLKWKQTRREHDGMRLSEYADYKEATSGAGVADYCSRKGDQQSVVGRFQVVLTKSCWLRRVFSVTSPVGRFMVEWNGRRTGSDSFPVLVNGKTQKLPVTLSQHGRRYEFRLSNVTGFIDVRTSLWMTLRSVKVWIGDELLYSEG